MQPSTVSSFLTGGVSVGIIAGVVSGLFYLVVAGFRWAGEARLHSGEWFQKQIQRRFATPSLEDVDRRNGSIMQSESSQVREFIEHLVEALVSGGIDHVNVNRLYTHPDYDRMFETYHSLLCDLLARLSFALQMAIANKPLEDSDSPSAAHTELKQLVQCVVREAMTLPALHKNSSNGTTSQPCKEDINSKTYEDILATAILNKVIERFQLARLDAPRMETDGNSNLLYKNRIIEHAPKYISSLEIGVTSGTSESVDGMGPSSLEDASWSESSALTEPTSLTIEECIEEEEEVTVYSSEEEENDATTGAELDFYLSGLNFIKRHRVPFPELGMDIVDGNDDSEDEESGSPQPTDLVSPVDSWEENWLFQRRRLKVGGVNQPLPVPMLVPNPSEDYRALIGDQDAEETSDLSDCSEGVYEGLLDDPPGNFAAGISRLSPELSDDSIGDFVLLPESDLELAEARNAEISNSVDSSSELGQQDSEYTEDYASVTQRQMNSLKRQHNLPESSPKPVPKPRTSVQSNASDSAIIISNGDTPPTDEAGIPLNDSDPIADLATPPRPGTELSQDDNCMNQAWTGTIAEREHKKWESAPPLQNNPYSSENILKRLSKSSLLDIRPTCQEKIELPEKALLPKVENISVQPSETTNISRYGRDYYVNSTRSPSSLSGQNVARPVEIVMTSDVELPVKRSATKELSQPQKDAELSQLVESEVSRLQKEINEREEQWLKNIKRPKSPSDSRTNKLNKSLPMVDCSMAESNGTFKPDERPKTPQEIIGEKILEHMMPKNIIIIEHADDNTLIKKENADADIKSFLGKSETKSKLASKTDLLTDNKTKITNGANKSSVNGKKPKKKEYLGSGSESSLLSSDSEGNIPMPSVKNLAKQFAERNNALNVPKAESPGSKLLNRTQFLTPDGQKTGQPMRELGVEYNKHKVHSLTARSISREFREELKQNRPTQLDRNLHASDSCPSQQSSSDLDTSTTAGYTSDESNSISPVPGLLRNNIAFWEQIQRNNK